VGRGRRLEQDGTAGDRFGVVGRTEAHRAGAHDNIGEWMEESDDEGVNQWSTTSVDGPWRHAAHMWSSRMWRRGRKGTRGRR
jgi:hypothetical protein